MDKKILDNNTKVVDWIKHHANVTPGKLATIDIASKRNYTYGEMNDRIGRLASFMKSLGVKQGDRVGFYAPNSTDILDIIFACWRIGAITLALNYRLTAEELTYQLTDADTKTLFFDTEFSETVTKIRKTAQVDNWIDLDGLGGESSFERGITNSPKTEEMIEQEFDDQCMLMYSSGTTGKPKGVIITHGMMFYSAINGISLSKASSDSVSLASMPIFHIGGLNVSCCPVLRLGATTVVLRNFDPEIVLDLINDQELGIDSLFNVPAAYNALRQHPKNKTTDFSRIVSAIAGAESVPTPLIEWWYDRGLIIQEGYGLTESAASSILLPKEYVPDLAGSAGKPLMYTDIRVVNQSGENAQINSSGEIWLKGPTITPGYWRNDKATAKSFVDGWFKTGDIGKIDENGFVYIEERIDDMYVSGGENIYPAEVENVLYELEEIKEVAVIGVEDNKWGSVGCAIIVLKSDSGISKNKVIQHCEKKLANFKLPKHIIFIDNLPRSATGKVLKYVLRKNYQKIEQGKK